jgi:hypothetical protein
MKKEKARVDRPVPMKKKEGLASQKWIPNPLSGEFNS